MKINEGDICFMELYNSFTGDWDGQLIVIRSLFPRWFTYDCGNYKFNVKNHSNSTIEVFNLVLIEKGAFK